MTYNRKRRNVMFKIYRRDVNVYDLLISKTSQFASTD